MSNQMCATNSLRKYWMGELNTGGDLYMIAQCTSARLYHNYVELAATHTVQPYTNKYYFTPHSALALGLATVKWKAAAGTYHTKI